LDGRRIGFGGAGDGGCRVEVMGTDGSFARLPGGFRLLAVLFASPSLPSFGSPRFVVLFHGFIGPHSVQQTSQDISWGPGVESAGEESCSGATLAFEWTRCAEGSRHCWMGVWRWGNWTSSRSGQLRPFEGNESLRH
jgi:hypothetical protein